MTRTGRTILLTAFEPFGGRSQNASEEALNHLIKHPDLPAGLTLKGYRLPVETGTAGRLACRIIDTVRPDVVICLGEARREAVCLERFGYNERRFLIPDNAGNLIEGEPILPGAPDRYPATLPLETMLVAMQATGVPVQLSEDPGRYLCNEVLYSVLHHLAEHAPDVRAGFIHVPHLPRPDDEPETPSLPADEVVRALIAGLGSLFETSP